MRSMFVMLVLVSLVITPACDTDDFLVASDGCPSSTGAHEDSEGDGCVTGECEEEAVSIDVVAGIPAGPASHRESNPLTRAQERR